MPLPNSSRRPYPADSRAPMAALPPAAALICPAPAFAAQDTDKDQSADKDVTLSVATTIVHTASRRRAPNLASNGLTNFGMRRVVTGSVKYSF